MKSFVSKMLFPALLMLTGCGGHQYYAVAPPPPPPAYAPPQVLLDTASRNGFQTGVQDGRRDAYYGSRFAPEHTRAYHAAPGYTPYLGPFPSTLTPSAAPTSTAMTRATGTADLTRPPLSVCHPQPCHPRILFALSNLLFVIPDGNLRFLSPASPH